MIKKITDNVWKVPADSNVYLLENEKILIDTGNRSNRNILKQFLAKVVDFDDIKTVIFTHLHFDHIGNFDLFENAKFYAHEQEIRSFRQHPVQTVLDDGMADKFKAKLVALPQKIGPLEVIHTPGHTKGQVCLWYEEKGILFSGDMLFDRKTLGRTDLPTSEPEQMHDSVLKLINYNYKILCPGHDY